MTEYVSLRIHKKIIEDHVKRICRSNLRRPAKICKECPILGPVIDIMEEKKWYYNEPELRNHIKYYKMSYQNDS